MLSVAFFIHLEACTYCIQEQALWSFCNSKSGKEYHHFIPLSQLTEGEAGTAWFNYCILSMPWASELLAGGTWRLVDWMLEHLQHKHFSYWHLNCCQSCFVKGEGVFFLSPGNEGPLNYPHIQGLTLGRLRSPSLLSLSPHFQSIITAFHRLQACGFLWDKWLRGEMSQASPSTPFCCLFLPRKTLVLTLPKARAYRR